MRVQRRCCNKAETATTPPRMGQVKRCARVCHSKTAGRRARGQPFWPLRHAVHHVRKKWRATLFECIGRDPEARSLIPPSIDRACHAMLLVAATDAPQHPDSAMSCTNCAQSVQNGAQCREQAFSRQPSPRQCSQGKRRLLAVHNLFHASQPLCSGTPTLLHRRAQSSPSLHMLCSPTLDNRRGGLGAGRSGSPSASV